jgi:hypothetical protein
MKRFVVTVTFDKGQTSCVPARVEISAGDTIRWTAEDGELAVDFGNNNPFTKTQVWTAARDQMTPVATVKSDLVGGAVFQPTISINKAVVAVSLGDLIFR